MPDSVAIIGAGIVGLSAAVQLQREGHRVSVIDRAEPMQACSAGNAGYLSEANIFPPANRDILLQLPKLLLSKGGPLVIRPAYLPTMLPWGGRAISTLRTRAQRTIMDTLAGMTIKAYTSLADLAAHAGASDLLSREGGLVVFRDRLALDKKSKAIPQWRRYGISARLMSTEEVRTLEPALSPEIAGSIFFENSGRCCNPKRLGLVYADHLARHGSEIVLDEVRAVMPASEKGILVQGAQTSRFYDKVIVCGGFWSTSLLSPYFQKIPLVSERGYHLMLPTPGLTLNRPIVFGEPHFAATPMEEGLRLAGTAEFSDPDSPSDMRRATMLLTLAQRYLSSIDGTGATPWMGIRPSFPDGLPAIGSVHELPGLHYAFGHSHNGLTLSAVTAKCIEALVAGSPPPIDLTPLSLNRFTHY